MTVSILNYQSPRDPLDESKERDRFGRAGQRFAGIAAIYAVTCLGWGLLAQSGVAALFGIFGNWILGGLGFSFGLIGFARRSESMSLAINALLANIFVVIASTVVIFFVMHRC
jgi:hypothetical protein